MANKDTYNAFARTVATSPAPVLRLMRRNILDARVMAHRDAKVRMLDKALAKLQGYKGC